MRNEHQYWAIRNCFNFFLKLLIIRFLFLREWVDLFHLIDDVEVNFLLSYFDAMGWCSLKEFVLRKSLVFGLSFILFRKYRVSYK